MNRLHYLAKSGHTFVFSYNDTDRDRRQVMLWAGMLADDCDIQFEQSDFEAVAEHMDKQMTGTEVAK